MEPSSPGFRSVTNKMPSVAPSSLSKVWEKLGPMVNVVVGRMSQRAAWAAVPPSHPAAHSTTAVIKAAEAVRRSRGRVFAINIG